MGIVKENLCKPLIIFEGPDGSGKTTLAKHFAEVYHAKYVHFGPLPNVDTGLARMYVEAMLPALLGYQAVVLDRNWMSEIPYGIAFRGSKDRLGVSRFRMLERLAMRCGALVVNCCTSWDATVNNFKKRSKEGGEYLDDYRKLKIVYDLYRPPNVLTCLPNVHYNYAKRSTSCMINMIRTTLVGFRNIRHPVNLKSAGNLKASIAIIQHSSGDNNIGNDDSLYQWPSASLWHRNDELTTNLAVNSISEYNLFWICADQDISLINTMGPELVIAMDKKSIESLNKHCPDVDYVSFNEVANYSDLCNLISEVLNGTN